MSLHQEFDLLAKAGLSPLRVLQMTTLDGAEFLRREATDGTVEEGKAANLVLLSGNPIEDVANLHAVDAVVCKGKYYAQDALEGMKERVAGHMASSERNSPQAGSLVPNSREARVGFGL